MNEFCYILLRYSIQDPDFEPLGSLLVAAVILGVGFIAIVAVITALVLKWIKRKSNEGGS